MNDALDTLIGKLVRGCIDPNDPRVLALIGRNGAGMAGAPRRQIPDMGDCPDCPDESMPPMSQAGCYHGASEALMRELADGKTVFGTMIHPKDARIFMVGFAKKNSGQPQSFSEEEAKKKLKEAFGDSWKKRFSKLSNESRLAKGEGRVVKAEVVQKNHLFATAKGAGGIDQKNAAILHITEGASAGIFVILAMPKSREIKKKYANVIEPSNLGGLGAQCARHGVQITILQ